MIDIEKDAKEILEKAKADRAKMSKKEEPKGASPAPSAEKEKTEGKTEEEKLKEAEAAKKAALEKDKEDEAILAKKEEELDEKQKARKQELLKVAKEKEKGNVQKRIDELSGKVKALENDNASTKAERDAAKKELDDLKKQLHQTPEDKVKEKIKKELSTRVTKYIEEDKELPREDRREMTKEELDEWFGDDPTAASDWMSGRRIRRYREEEALRQEEFTNAKASEIVEKLKKGYDIIASKYPELDVSNRRAELEKEGKSKKEIRETLAKENPRWKVFIELYEEDANSPKPKYLLSDDPVSGFIAEFERRIKPKEEKKDDDEVTKLKEENARLKEENDRLSGLDTGITSTRYVEPETPTPEIEKKTEELGLDVGLTKEAIKRSIDRRKGARK